MIIVIIFIKKPDSLSVVTVLCRAIKWLFSVTVQEFDTGMILSQNECSIDLLIVNDLYVAPLILYIRWDAFKSFQLQPTEHIRREKAAKLQRNNFYKDKTIMTNKSYYFVHFLLIIPCFSCCHMVKGN